MSEHSLTSGRHTSGDGFFSLGAELLGIGGAVFWKDVWRLNKMNHRPPEDAANPVSAVTAGSGESQKHLLNFLEFETVKPLVWGPAGVQRWMRYSPSNGSPIKLGRNYGRSLCVYNCSSEGLLTWKVHCWCRKEGSKWEASARKPVSSGKLFGRAFVQKAANNRPFWTGTKRGTAWAGVLPRTRGSVEEPRKRRVLKLLGWAAIDKDADRSTRGHVADRSQTGTF